MKNPRPSRPGGLFLEVVSRYLGSDERSVLVSYRPGYVGSVRQDVVGVGKQSDQISLSIKRGDKMISGHLGVRVRVARNGSQVAAGGVRIGNDARHVASPDETILAEEEEVVQRRAIERSARVIVGTHEQVVCGARIIHRNLDGIAAVIRAVARPHRENLANDRVQSRQL